MVSLYTFVSFIVFITMCNSQEEIYYLDHQVELVGKTVVEMEEMDTVEEEEVELMDILLEMEDMMEVMENILHSPVKEVEAVDSM